MHNVFWAFKYIEEEEYKSVFSIVSDTLALVQDGWSLPGCGIRL